MTIATSAAIAAASARVLFADRLPDALGFSTDTRTIAPGDAFVALRGERFDGHSYAREAIARGAVALVVSERNAVPLGVAALVVEDTTAAYLAFAGVARTMLGARVAAITGSAGKTTSKTFLAQILANAASGPVVATPANENNEIGVAKLLLGASADAKYVVIEFGARHFGEIEPLARAARPDVALLTNVGEAHLEIMGSPERLAQTKWAIFATGARAVLNANDAISRERGPALRANRTWFGDADDRWSRSLASGDRFVSLARVREVPPRDDFAIVESSGSAARYPTDLVVPGDHNRTNALAASATALALGIAPVAIAKALSSLALPAGRYERMNAGGIDLIFDAYNASMSGTLATLASFAHETCTRRIAVLGSMAELGADAADMHARVGAAAANAQLDALLVGGDFAIDMLRGARDAGFASERIVPFATNALAVAWLRANARDGDMVLLKGSRRYKLEEIVAGLSA